MQTSNSFTSTNNLRLEIAILQEDIEAQNPGVHEFKIPVISTGETVGTVYTRTKTANKKKTTRSVSRTQFDNTISLRVPKEYTVYYGKRIIPKGTRFIVACIGGNLNDIKIVDRYDSADDEGNNGEEESDS